MDEIWTAVDDYYDGLILEPDSALDAAMAANREAGLPPIDVTPAQGRFLHLLARGVGARRILEIGTLGGYSTIWLARAVLPEGSVVTCEIDPDRAALARANVDRAGLAEAVEIRTGPALDTLAALSGPFDLVFVDADKPGNADYLAATIPLTRPGGVILVDNVVRDGRVVDPGDDGPDVVGTRRFAEALAAESRVDATMIQTVGRKGYDGFVLAVVR